MRMVKFVVEHAVDTSSGTAKIGRCHVITEAEKVINESLSERIKEMQQKNLIEEEPTR